MGGHDPYSASKGCAELVTAAFRDSFFAKNTGGRNQPLIATVRAGNVIGGGDWAEDRLIPDVIRAASAQEKVKSRNLHSIRPWQHVLEPVSGYLLLAQKLYEEGVAYAEGWNFGPDDEDVKPVQWIVERIIQQCSNGASWELDQGNNPHEAHYLKLDCSKAKKHLGWYPKLKLIDALENTVAWHQAYLGDDDMRVFSLNQILGFRDK